MADLTPPPTERGAGNAAYGSAGKDPHQANLNEYGIDPITGLPVTRPAATNAERQRDLLESVAREREIAEGAARFTGRAAGNAETARNEAIATRDRINRETTELLEQLLTIRRNIESRMEDAKTNAELARTGAEAAERQAINASTSADLSQARAQEAKTNAELARTGAEAAERQAETAKRQTETAKRQTETARNEAQGARNEAQGARNEAQGARTGAEGQARNAATAAGLAQLAVRRAQNTATKTEGSMRIAKEASIQAKTSADASAESAAKAVKTVKELNTVVANYKESLKTYTENKDAELQKKVNEQLAKITKEMDEIKSQMTKLAKEDKVTPALVASIQQSNKGIQANLSNSAITNAPTNAPTNSSEYTRGKMGISFIKFEGHTNILNPYTKNRNNNNIINPILPVNLNVNLEDIDNFADVAPGNYLFVDNFQLKLNDFKSMNRNDFIQLILSPKNYIEFLDKLEQSSVERKFVDFRKKTKLNKEERKINKENAKIYAAKLFANEETFNIVIPKTVNRNGYYFEYIIMSHEIKKKGIVGPDAFRFDVKREQLQNNDTDKGYTFFTFKIKLILDSRERDEMKPGDFKAVKCNQRKARIYKIMGSLEGTKQIVTAILGPEGAKKYLVDDTKMKELHGMAKPLPSNLAKTRVKKRMFDKLSYVSQVDGRDLPRSRRNEQRALQSNRARQRSLASSFSQRMSGGKKTKRINYKVKNNKKTKKRIFYEKQQKIKKSKKMKKIEKTRKTRKN